MYLGIDVGGTKTLFAVFDGDGKIIYEKKIPTNKNYVKFLKDVAALIKTDLGEYDVRHACCAIPGKIDRRHGIAKDFGSLVWHNVPMRDDLKKLLGGVPVEVENDANLGGLSEALLVHKKYRKVLYLTVSTGIGGGIIINGILDADFLDFEPGQMMISHEGVLQQWEDFASGRALKARYGKLASEIDDASIWRAYSLDLAIGIQELLATIQPDVVIMGGGVGSHFEKFGAYLEGELVKMKNPLVGNPPIVKAKRPEEAVIYGCFDYIKQAA